MNQAGRHQGQFFGLDESAHTHKFEPSSWPAAGATKCRSVDAKTLKKSAAIVESLDSRRQQKKMSKAELARKLKKHPASFRRLFSTASNPELHTLIQIADALDADIKIVPRRKRNEYVPM